MSHYDFANILFAGPCNQRCPYCIGRQLDPALNGNNLDLFPLRNLERFVDGLRQHDVRQITLTGTNTDPQLYQYEARLVNWLRKVVPRARISLHTNGQLAVAKMDVFNLYDRTTISIPSFDPSTFFRMTGVHRMPDLDAIVNRTRIPVKVSCILSDENSGQVESFLDRCHKVGVTRLVFRQQYGRAIAWTPPPQLNYVSTYRNNPVYDDRGMQVTYWRFEQTSSRSLNLFADGSISTQYLLAKHATRPRTC
jgi:molybdenum cofactor biosynthesis enzyme MoaA